MHLNNNIVQIKLCKVRLCWSENDINRIYNIYDTIIPLSFSLNGRVISAMTHVPRLCPMDLKTCIHNWSSVSVYLLYTTTYISRYDTGKVV
jgi:hypothetical protein